MLEETANMIPEKRHDLLSLCGMELLEIYVTLHDMYFAVGDRDKSSIAQSRIMELLNSPNISVTPERKEQLMQSLCI